MIYGFNAGSIVAGLGLNIKGWNASMTKVASDTTSINKWLEKNSSYVRGFGLALGGLGTAITGTLGLFAKFAMDVEESENLFEVSMGNMAASARGWSDELAKRLNLNSHEVRRMVGTFNVMFDAMRFGESDAYNMSTYLTEIANDMSSFYNIPIEVAFQKLQAGITGELEPLKRLGIMLNQTVLEQDEFFLSLGKSYTQLTEQEKVQIRFNQIIAQTGKAQGDLARTINSGTNVLRGLKNMAMETAAEIGKSLIPVISTVGIMARGALAWVKEFVQENPALVSAIVLSTAALGLLATALGGVALASMPLTSLITFLTKEGAGRKFGLVVWGYMVKPIESLTLAFGKLKVAAAWAWGSISAPVVAVIAAVAAVGLAVYTLSAMWRQNTFSMQRQVKELWEALVTGTKITFDAMGIMIKNAWNFWVDSIGGPIKMTGEFLSYLFVDFLGGLLKDALNKFIGFFSGLGAIAGTAWEKIKAGDFSNFFSDLASAFVEEADADHVGAAVEQWMEGFSGEGVMAPLLKKTGDLARETKAQLAGAWENFKSDMASAVDVAAELTSKLWESAKNMANIGADFATYFVQGFREALPDVIQQARLDINNLLGTDFFQSSWTTQDYRASALRQNEEILESARAGYAELKEEAYSQGGNYDLQAGLNIPSEHADYSSTFGGLTPQVTVNINSNIDPEGVSEMAINTPAGQERIADAVVNNMAEGGIIEHAVTVAAGMGG